MTTKIGIIIQGRLASTRLKNKILLPFYGNKTLIEILIERLKCNKNNVPVILATTTNKYDDTLVEAVEGKIPIFRGKEHNVLDRFIGTMKSMKLTHAIRVCSDNPFLSLKYVDELISMCTLNCDYIGYTIDGSLPSIRSHIGYFAECVSLKSLVNTVKYTNSSFDHEHVTYYIHSNPDKFNNRLLPYRANDERLRTLRLTLDTSDDFLVLSSIYSILIKNKKSLTLSNILKVLKDKPLYSVVMKRMIDKFKK